MWKMKSNIDKMLLSALYLEQTLHLKSCKVVVKGWNPQLDLQIENIRSLPIWVQLPELDIKFWGNESLSKIGSILGIPLKTDRYTKDKTVIRYACMLIDMQLDGHFPDNIEFFNEEDVLIRQQVHYEWKPLECTHCKMFRHKEIHCKKKEGIRTEWRLVQKPIGEIIAHPLQAEEQQPSSPMEEFTQGKHPDFQKIVDSITPLHIINPLAQLKTVMNKLQSLLSRVHKDNFVDLKAQ
ncbi:hypothetical protein Cgig2_018538 [Carnegiea gigantea]|uniref:DUF4283 domain-containing protein n=1 Tax=Carnegiea gigantea TaxID=171969 RepID=A0A9Q1KLR4_9CARY|nr:hypothetical protein Cgig2_018538 [Carnegiea gigantea]